MLAAKGQVLPMVGNSYSSARNCSLAFFCWSS